MLCYGQGRIHVPSPLSAADVLAWLNCYGRQVIIQDLPKSRKRAKNRVILQFAQPGTTELGAVGASDLPSAILRARARANGGQQFD